MAGNHESTQQMAVGTAVEPDDPLPLARKFYVVHNQKYDREAITRLPRAGRPGLLNRALQAQLGKLLRAIFSDVAEEPVPERFVKLLEALEAREKSQ